MSRAAARKESAQEPDPLDASPSNDVAKPAAGRAAVYAAAVALDPAAVKRIPVRAAAKLVWMEGVHRAAWSARDEFARVPLDGHAVTERELRRFADEIAFARDELATRGVRRAVRSTGPVTPAALRACGVRLCDALSLRYVGDRPSRDVLRVVRRGMRRDVTLGVACVQLEGLTADPAVEAWLRTLPHDEGAALDDLRRLHTAWTQQSLTHAPPADLAARAFTVCGQTLRRVLAVGRYLTRRDPVRKAQFAGCQATVKLALPHFVWRTSFRRKQATG